MSTTEPTPSDQPQEEFKPAVNLADLDPQGLLLSEHQRRKEAGITKSQTEDQQRIIAEKKESAQEHYAVINSTESLVGSLARSTLAGLDNYNRFGKYRRFNGDSEMGSINVEIQSPDGTEITYSVSSTFLEASIVEDRDEISLPITILVTAHRDEFLKYGRPDKLKGTLGKDYSFEVDFKTEVIKSPVETDSGVVLKEHEIDTITVRDTNGEVPPKTPTYDKIVDLIDFLKREVVNTELRERQ